MPTGNPRGISDWVVVELPRNSFWHAAVGLLYVTGMLLNFESDIKLREAHKQNYDAVDAQGRQR